MSMDQEIRMWRREYLNLWMLAKQTWQAFRDNQLHARCAQFAYYAMLGLVPLIILTISIIARLPVNGERLKSLSFILQRSLPEDAFHLIEIQIESIQETSSTSLIIVNVLIFSFAGARLFLTISESLNMAYGVPARFRRARMFGLSSILPLACMLALLLAMATMILLPLAISWSIHWMELQGLETVVLQTCRWVVLTGFLLLVTSTLYSLIPAIRVPWRLLTPGNVFAVTGWLLVTQGFRYYVDHFSRYNTTYGTLGGVIALLLWLYLSGAMLMIGGQINGVIFGQEQQHRQDAAPAVCGEAGSESDGTAG